MLSEILLDSQTLKGRISKISQSRGLRMLYGTFAAFSLVLFLHFLYVQRAYHEHWAFKGLMLYAIVIACKLLRMCTGASSMPVISFFYLGFVEPAAETYRNEFNFLLTEFVVLSLFLGSLLGHHIDSVAADDFEQMCKTVELAIIFVPCVEIFIIASLVCIELFASISCKETTYAAREIAGSFASGASHECSICRDEFQGEDVVKMLKCGHLFHSACIDEWINIKKLCPLCKKDFMEGNSIREVLTTGTRK
ncbi:hypothetical protein PAPHI01_1510 [Pancytospora philotis]|nr:hypothetical protein PAPHI01_1510 [Pancytospora philotis]